MDFKKFSSLIMVEQTLFALPFAYIGVLFAGGATLFDWIWTTLALVSARTAGMSFNRVIDAEIDARNPRTRNRGLPKGEVTRSEVWVLAVISCLVLILSARMLNLLCFYLSFPAVAMLFAYSYFKRFSSSSHFFLGAVEALAPIGGYLAVTGTFDLPPLLLGAAIMLWIAGLDIVYAIQDMDFDAASGLHSVPVKFGKTKSLALSLICYVLSLEAMIIAGVMTEKGIAYWFALIFIGVVFAYQQTLARQENLQRAIKEFFKVNAYVSPALLMGTLFDALLG